MALVQCPERSRVRAHLALPIGARVRDRQGQSAEQTTRDSVQQRCLAGEVPIERHRLDTQLAAQPAHAQLVEAILVDIAERGVHDAGAGQGRTNRPVSVGCCLTLGRGVSVGREDRAGGLRCLAMLFVHRRKSLHRASASLEWVWTMADVSLTAPDDWTPCHGAPRLPRCVAGSPGARGARPTRPAREWEQHGRTGRRDLADIRGGEREASHRDGRHPRCDARSGGACRRAWTGVSLRDRAGRGGLCDRESARISERCVGSDPAGRSYCREASSRGFGDARPGHRSLGQLESS